MFKRIGLITNLNQREVHDILEILLEYLASQQAEIYIDSAYQQLTAAHKEIKPVSTQQLGAQCDLIIVLGGDGTMLMAAHSLCMFDVPLLGINTGRLGFLADIAKEAIQADLAAVLTGDYLQEKRFMLFAEVIQDGTTQLCANALNDVVIHKWNIARLVEIETYVDGIFVHSQRADGMIIATPTGSTAYALSGGGPIIYPTLNTLLLVPICPHALNNRPIVVGGDSEIEIIIGPEEAEHVQLTCDGELKKVLMRGDRLRIKKNIHAIRLIHPPGHDPFFVLREKLQWGKTFVNPAHHS